ncbi:MAG TPA: alpha,alpha-trehalose-phosphate synthase (UDP-forming) [Candidatus Hypogeohydataceae bacterium YC40]
MRLELKMVWDKESLKEVVRAKIGDRKFIVVSNREPYLHVFQGDEIRCVTPPSGVVTALDPVLRACGGIWVAHGSGDADKEVVDSNDRVQVPPEGPAYTLRRVWLTKEEEEAYYYGFSNEGLWPLCHIAFVRPIFNEADWTVYRKVNEKFAESVLREIGDGAGFVFVQDYHFCLLSKILKEKRPDITVAQFWHIPWPNREAFRVCPWGEEILRGLLGNDLLCFQIRYHCQNFLDTIERTIEAKIDYERFSVIREGKETLVRPFPISVDFEKINQIAQDPGCDEEIKKIKRILRLKNRLVGVGVDRIDYTKGIVERFGALDRFFERYPEYLGHFTFIQLGAISRIRIKSYKEWNDEIYHLMIDINEKYHTRDWQPIILQKSHFGPKDLISYYRMADVCIVSSLHDGMNLVAKEFVASRFDNNGVLILSRFTGSARELIDALLINPFATDNFADTIKQSLEMPAEEKAKRMEKMREVIKENNVYRWAGKIIGELKKLA